MTCYGAICLHDGAFKDNVHDLPIMAAMDNSIKLIVKQVAEAQNLDLLGSYKDAYIKYLQSTQNVIQQLLDSASDTGLHFDANTKKMVNVGAMCMQRAEELVNHKIGLQDQRSATSPTCQTVAGCNNDMPGTMLPSATSMETLCDKSYSVAPSVAVTRSRMSGDVENLSPMELAEKQNRQIMLAYQARMAGLSSIKATNLSLSLQRRLAENIAIGKAREKALAKKRDERRLRLKAEAARQFARTTVISKDELERRELYTKVFQFEQDNTWLLDWREKLKENPKNCTVVEKLISLILRTFSHPYTKLLHSNQNKIFDMTETLIKRWKSSYPGSDFKETPASEITTTGKGDCLMSSSDQSEFDYCLEHPAIHSDLSNKDNSCEELHVNSKQTKANASSGNMITSESSEFVFLDGDMKNEESDTASQSEDPSKVLDLQELDREAILSHLSNITSDTQNYLEKLVTMFIVIYESLDHATGRDCCYSVLAEYFYKPLWSKILELFRIIYKKEESQIQAVMLKYKDSSPVDLQVPRKFCLLPEDCLLMPEGYQPYQAAISELQAINKMVSPLTKLECIVRVSRSICQCVEEFYNTNNSNIPSIGADDLLPLLSYVVIKTNLPQIYAECQALEELVHEGYLLGEEGYCLTSLQTAMMYVISLPLKNSPS